MSRKIIKAASLSMALAMATFFVSSANAEIICSVCAHDTSTGVTVCRDVPCPKAPAPQSPDQIA